MSVTFIDIVKAVAAEHGYLVAGAAMTMTRWTTSDRDGMKVTDYAVSGGPRLVTLL